MGRADFMELRDRLTLVRRRVQAVFKAMAGILREIDGALPRKDLTYQLPTPEELLAEARRVLPPNKGFEEAGSEPPAKADAENGRRQPNPEGKL